MQKSILFDLDGTLTDSGEGIINCAIPALEHFGIQPPSREEMRVFVGPPLHETFVRFGVPEDQADEAVRIFRSRYAPVGLFENIPYPGIPEMLEKLQQEGYSLYVATSKPEPMAVKILGHFDMAKYFTRICGASADRSRSTKDAVIAYLLEQAGNDSSMIMVGDTKFDVLGAAVHGISCIGVAWGYGTVEEMIQAGACSIANTADELYSLLTDNRLFCNEP